MSDKKQNMVGVKLNDLQVQLLDKLIETGKAKTRSAAIQYLINEKAIKGI
ncbi:TPA: hypothetical protein ACN6Y1_003049 [Escherichia albertii]|nr:hypothetical protein [Escherichia coli]ELN7123795.1 hypothetical protein [Shigella sonnei]DAL94487.1 MAG TPA: Toxin protein parE-1, Antitoxin protein, antitoxin, complex, Caulobacter, TA.6A [Caudoviricetes sp.]EFT2974682.1 hypothetical protein [Escherichia coli]EHP6358792.1 hypothetical protein [Escherichia coli]EHT0819626.1 hypothetical protein [Escherichia coli]